MRPFVLKNMEVEKLLDESKLRIVRNISKRKIRINKGDSLWVKEGYSLEPHDTEPAEDGTSVWSFYYSAGGVLEKLTSNPGYDPVLYNYRDNPAVTLPRWAARLFLEVVDVKEEGDTIVIDVILKSKRE